MEVYEDSLKKDILSNLSKRRPWTDYNDIRSRSPITLRELQYRLIESSKINYKLATICTVIYLTASRIKEIIPYKYLGAYRDKLPLIKKPGIKFKDIEEVEDDDGTKWVYFTTRNEKQCTKRGDIGEYDNGVTLEERYKSIVKEEVKTIKLLYEPECKDFILLELVKEYISSHDYDLEDEIFGEVVSYHITRFLKKVLRITPHILRHLRAEHLRTVYNLDIAELKEYGGWKSLDMPMRYAKSDIEQIGNKFLNIAKAWQEKYGDKM